MDATRSIEARDDAEELESGHRRKRRRTKGVSACTACQHRKSRCELVNDAGCHRCTVLGTWCSIANHRASPPIQADVNRFCSTAERTQHRDKDEAVHTPNSNTASVNQSSLSELLERIKRIEAATQVLMMDQSSGLILNFLPRASTSNAGRLDLPNQPDDQSDSHSTHPSQPDESPIIHSASSLIGGMYGLIPNEPLANPVAAGLTTDALLRVAYDRALLAFRQVLPLPRLIAVDTPSDHHPFLQCCVLLYSARGSGLALRIMSRHQYLRLERAIKNYLSNLASFRPHDDIVIALLVLSLSSSNSYEPRLTSTVDPFHAVDLAMKMAIMTGLDSAGLAISRRASDGPIMSFDSGLLQKAQIWHCLINRSARVDLITSPLLSRRPTDTGFVQSIQQVSRLHIESFAVLDSTFQSQFLTLTEPVSFALRDLRCSLIPELSLIEAIVESMHTLHARAVDWRSRVLESGLSSKSYLVAMSLLTEMLLCFKLSNDVGVSLPSPLAPESRLSYMLDMAGSFLLRAEEYIQHIVWSHMDLSLLPNFDVVLSILAYTACLQASRVEDSGESSADVQLNHDQVIFREKLLVLHPYCGLIISAITNGDPPDTAWRKVRQSGYGEEEGLQFIDWQALEQASNLLFGTEFLQSVYGDSSN